jgi:hypothetical protein
MQRRRPRGLGGDYQPSEPAGCGQLPAADGRRAHRSAATPTGSAAWHRPPHWRSTPGPGRGVADTHGHLGYCRHSPVVLQTRTVLEGTAGTHGWWQKVARAYAVDVTGGGWCASAAASHRPHSAGVSALMAACKNGNADAVRLLLAFGPCPSRPLLVPSALPPVARPANTCPAADRPFLSAIERAAGCGLSQVPTPRAARP